jgi:hypothetical protein
VKRNDVKRSKQFIHIASRLDHLISARRWHFKFYKVQLMRTALAQGPRKKNKLLMNIIVQSIARNVASYREKLVWILWTSLSSFICWRKEGDKDIRAGLASCPVTDAWDRPHVSAGSTPVDPVPHILGPPWTVGDAGQAGEREPGPRIFQGYSNLEWCQGAFSTPRTWKGPERNRNSFLTPKVFQSWRSSFPSYYQKSKILYPYFFLYI